MTRVIANPPLGIYGNASTEARHTPFLLLLDTAARYALQQGEDVRFPANAYNLYGKKANAWSQTPTATGIETLARARVAADTTRRLLGLMNDDTVFDTETERGITQDFLALHERGYLLREGDAYLLDCPRIAERHDLLRAAHDIRIVPLKARHELEAMLRDNITTPVRITRDTPFAPENPLGGERIGPLFALANMWDHLYPDAAYTLAASHDVIGKYALLRMLCRTALQGVPGFDELLVWPRVRFDGSWDLPSIVRDRYHADMLRVALLSKVPSDSTNVTLHRDGFKGARNAVYLIANLRKVVPDIADTDEEPYPGYHDDMQAYRYPKALQTLGELTRALSKDIATGTAPDARERYGALLEGLVPFMPATVALCRRPADD